jgi:hypothetical protein
MNSSYEMLESWYEAMKGDKELSLKEAKELVQSIEKCDSLKEKGIVERKTYLDTQYIQYVPTQFRPYFLIGLFDGDGHIAAKSGHISISGNKANLIKILWVYFK